VHGDAGVVVVVVHVIGVHTRIQLMLRQHTHRTTVTQTIRGRRCVYTTILQCAYTSRLSI
jgi:hypothetical protein